MTNLNTGHHIDDINAVPKAIGTQSLYAAFAAGLSRARCMLGQRGAWRAAQALRRQLRQIYKTEKSNFELWLRRKLRVDAAWRQRVLNDLGGHAALRRWDKRAAIAASDIQKSENLHQTSRSGSTLSPAPRKKTDNPGHYRLASIKGLPRAYARLSAGASYSRYVPLYPGPKPIEITPNDLRHGSKTAEYGYARIEAPDTLWLSMLTPIVNMTTQLNGLEADILEAECDPAWVITPAGTSAETGPTPQGLAARVATAPG